MKVLIKYQTYSYSYNRKMDIWEDFLSPLTNDSGVIRLD